MECLSGCMADCIHSRQKDECFADKRQELSDKMSVVSWGILACQLMIYSSYHLFYPRYIQCMPEE